MEMAGAFPWSSGTNAPEVQRRARVQLMTNPPAKAPTIEQLTAASLLDLVYARLRLSVLLSVGVSLVCAGLLASLFPTDRLVLGVR